MVGIGTGSHAVRSRVNADRAAAQVNEHRAGTAAFVDDDAAAAAQIFALTDKVVVEFIHFSDRTVFP